MATGRSNCGCLTVPGLFRVIVDEADTLLIDEAVTPLIISNSPDDEANATLYSRRRASWRRTARRWIAHFIDRPHRSRRSTSPQSGQRPPDELTDAAHPGDFW